MDTRHMLIEFETGLQSIDEEYVLTNKLDSTDILYFLNLGQDRFLTDNFLVHDKDSGSVSVFRRSGDVLRKLVTRSNITKNGLTTLDGGVKFDIPDDYMHYIRSTSGASVSGVDTDYGGGVDVLTNVTVTDHDFQDKITTIYNQAVVKNPMIIIEGSEFIIYKDTFTTLSELEVVYLKKPKTLVLEDPDDDSTLTSEIDDIFHKNIVETSIRIFREEYKYKTTTK